MLFGDSSRCESKFFLELSNVKFLDLYLYLVLFSIFCGVKNVYAFLASFYFDLLIVSYYTTAGSKHFEFFGLRVFTLIPLIDDNFSYLFASFKYILYYRFYI